jgi:hypothetical protein
MIYPEDMNNFSSIRYSEKSILRDDFFAYRKLETTFEHSESSEIKRLKHLKQLEFSLTTILDCSIGYNKSSLQNLSLNYFFEIESPEKLVNLISWISGNLKIINEQDETLKKTFSSNILEILKLVTEDANFSSCFFEELQTAESQFKSFLRLHLFKKLQESKNKDFKIKCLKSLYSLSLTCEILEKLNLIKNEIENVSDFDSTISEDYLIGNLLPKMKLFYDFNRIYITTNRPLLITELFYSEEILKIKEQDTKSLLSFLINDVLVLSFIKNEHACDLENSLKEESCSLRNLKSELAINETLIQNSDNLRDINKLCEKNLHLRSEVLEKITSLKETEKLVILAKAKNYL